MEDKQRHVRGNTTYGLRPQALARLLRLGLAGRDAREGLGTRPSPRQVLRHFLADKPFLGQETAKGTPALFDKGSDEMLLRAERSVGDLLLDPETDLGVIQALKDYGKRSVRSDDTENGHAASTVIYYAAIASALVFHGEKISRHPYPRLGAAYLQLEEEPWLPPELKALFRKARTICWREGRRSE